MTNLATTVKLYLPSRGGDDKSKNALKTEHDGIQASNKHIKSGQTPRFSYYNPNAEVTVNGKPEIVQLLLVEAK